METERSAHAPLRSQHIEEVIRAAEGTDDFQ
jgi:hypothetical protein